MLDSAGLTKSAVKTLSGTGKPEPIDKGGHSPHYSTVVMSDSMYASNMAALMNDAGKGSSIFHKNTNVDGYHKRNHLPEGVPTLKNTYTVKSGSGLTDTRLLSFVPERVQKKSFASRQADPCRNPCSKVQSTVNAVQIFATNLGTYVASANDCVFLAVETQSVFNFAFEMHVRGTNTSTHPGPAQ